MAVDTSKQPKNRGVCGKCGQIVSVHHVVRDGRVYLHKECPACGDTETMISTDSERYYEKREMAGYPGEAVKSCGLNCPTCDKHKDPTLVFIDVTNRCNMNCPICLANIPAMGFRFDPPMAYFEKIFERLSKISPKPKLQLFGGEPTVRKDLIEIITLAKRRYGLSARVVTNGLKLADEAYCKALVATGAEMMFSFDGLDPSIYERTRKLPRARELKMQGLANLSKFRKSKVTVMCCVGEGVNDMHMADTVAFLHEGRGYIAAMDLIPLTVEWGPEVLDVHSTTIEDVERIMAKAVPGMEFFPAGMLYKLATLRATFDVGRMTFGGAHPNCEVVSMMVSDGQAYHPANRYLRQGLEKAVREIVALDARMGQDLPKSLLGRLLGRKGRQAVYGWALWRLARRHVRFDKVFGSGAWSQLARILLGVARGRKVKDMLRAHTQCHSILRVIILPFEEKECVEAARLVDCPAAFAYEHPESGEIRLMPVCAWPAYKNDILRATAERYGVDDSTGEDGLTGLRHRAEVAGESGSRR
jgi:organic radical activating enzyme